MSPPCFQLLIRIINSKIKLNDKTNLNSSEKIKTALEYKDRKTMLELRKTIYEGLSPMDRLIDQLHPWVSFFIMPVFAFFNAGVEISTKALFSFFSSPVSMGVVLGLVIGKPVGILLFSWLATVFKMASLPTGVNWKQILGLGFLGGIGFTMSLFVTGLAIKNAFIADLAKMGVLSASLIASIIGALILILYSPNSTVQTQRSSVDCK